METNILIYAYIFYVVIITFLTLFVAHTLFKNARVFMVDIFHGKQEMALATNKLFEVGFYLLNLGFAFKFIKIYMPNDGFNLQNIFEILAGKIGGYTIYLGIMLFLNLFLFFRGRKVAKQKLALATQTKFKVPNDLR